MRQSREPLFQMHKRGYISFGKLALIHLIALLLALVTCAAVIVLVTGVNPLGVYEALVTGAVGNPRRLWVTIRESGILLLIAVGLTPAFRMRFWNIGAEGQILVGGIASAGLMILLGGKLPNALLLLLMLVCSMLFGMVWGLVPAYCKPSASGRIRRARTASARLTRRRARVGFRASAARGLRAVSISSASASSSS